MKNKFLKEFLQWVEAIAIAVVIAILIRGFLFEPVIIDGTSMMDTLKDGDRVVLNKIGVTINEPKAGDIVVLEMEAPSFAILKFLNDSNLAKKLLPTLAGSDYIKRIIAVEGDTVDIIGGYVYINGLLIDEPYLKQEGITRSMAVEMPYTVGKNKYFVMGDNRAASKDSRAFGAVDADQVIGYAKTRIWPLKSLGKIDRKS